MGFFKGMITGIVVGSAITMITDPVSDRQRRKMYKKTEGFFKNIGHTLDNAVDIFK